jgi:Ni,Fe-hydrogenase maturation factor
MSKILVLGNEFLKIDSLAKEVGRKLSFEHEIIEVKDTFQLMVYLQRFDNPIILDVVKGLSEVRALKKEDLKENSIFSAHDFDATYAIKLINKPVKIIGIPLTGDIKKIYEDIKILL